MADLQWTPRLNSRAIGAINLLPAFQAGGGAGHVPWLEAKEALRRRGQGKPLGFAGG